MLYTNQLHNLLKEMCDCLNLPRISERQAERGHEPERVSVTKSRTKENS